MRTIFASLCAISLSASAIATDTSAAATTPLTPATGTPPPAVAPRALTARATPRVNLNIIAPFWVSGRLELPSGVNPASACQGTVSIRAVMTWHHVTLATITGRLHKSCRYKVKLVLGTQGLVRRDVQILVRFSGNGVLLPKEARPAVVTVA